jgi:hypothetical protein
MIAIPEVSSFVMPGLDPGIDVFFGRYIKQGVDGRDI